jgi:hypothetical protein
MSLRKPWVLLLAIAAAVPLSACAKVAESATEKEPRFQLELINEAEGLNRLTLDPRAADRIGVKTEPIGVLIRFGGESQRTTVPYSAVLYNPDGATYVYTNPEPLIFVRHPITVDYVEGNLAVLAAGPPRGTSVVTVGVAELQGMEFGVGK